MSRPAAFSYNALLGFKLFPTDKVCIENGGKYDCSKSYYGCGGSVINKWHVITSMKCLRRKAIKGNEQYLRYSAFPNKHTVLFISESPRPHLCSKLALFNISC